MAEQEFVIIPPSDADLASMALIADLQFLDPNGSESINRKLHGIIPPGIYRGFKYALPGGMNLRIGLPNDPGTAVAQSNSVSITVQQVKPVDIQVPAGFAGLVVMTGFYKFGVPTKQVHLASAQDAAKIELVKEADLKDNQVILYTLNVPANATALTAAMISTNRRQDVSIAVEADIYQDLQNHINHPSAHTKAQVGLGNVQNWGATAAVNDASDTKYATAGAVKKAYDLAAAALPKAGGVVTGVIRFTGASGGISIHPTSDNATGIFNGTGDGAAQDKTNIQIKSWYGIGISPSAGSSLAAGLNSLWINARTGDVWTIGELYAQTNKKVYHQGFKPTSADVGALSLLGGIVNGHVRVNGGVLPLVGLPVAASEIPSATGLYVNEVGSTPANGYDGYSSILGVSPGDSKTRHFQMMVNAEGNSFKIRSAHINSGTEDGWNPWCRVYTEAFKPSAVDVGALPITGGTVSGGLVANVFTSSSSTGLRTAPTSDGSNVVVKAESGYAMFFKESNSPTKASEFIGISPSSALIFRQDDGSGLRKYVDYKIYHQGFKPTSADVGLGNVPNWAATAEVNDASNSKFATAGAVKKAYDLAAAALPMEGGTVTGLVKFADRIHVGNWSGQTNTLGENSISIGDADTGFKSVGDGKIDFMSNGNRKGGWSSSGGLEWAGDITTQGLKTTREVLTEHIHAFRQVYGKYGTFWRQDGNALYLLMTAPDDQYGTYNSSRPFTLDLSKGIASINGNAATATKLATARQINGTNFDGSGNITTANWGTARTLTVGNSSKSVNGAGDVAWTLDEIGALSLKGGTIDGDLALAGGVRPVVPLPVNATDIGAIGLYLNAANQPSEGGGYGSFATILGVSQANSTRHFQLALDSVGGFKVRVAHTSAGTPDGWRPWSTVYTDSNKPTSADVGLGNVQNWGATAAISDPSDVKYATAGAVKKAYDLAAAALPKAGGIVTGVIRLTGASGGISIHPTSDNSTGIFNGTGDGATQDKTNIQIKSWYGIGISPSAGSSLAAGLNSLWINARTGDVWTIGELYAKTDKKVYHQGFKPTSADVGALSLLGGDVNGNISITKSAPQLIFSDSTPGALPYTFVSHGGNIRLNVGPTTLNDSDVVWKWANASKELSTPGKLFASGGVWDGDKRVFSDRNTPSYKQVRNALGWESLSSAALNDLRIDGMVKLGTDVADRPSGTAGQGDTVLMSDWNSGAANQLYMSYNQPLLAIRRKAGSVWSGWDRVYTEGFKPTADDVRALAIAGGVMAGNIDMGMNSLVNVNVLSSKAGANLIRLGGDQGVVMGNASGSATVDYASSGTFQVRSNGKFGTVYTSLAKPTPEELSAVALSEVYAGGGFSGLLGKIPRFSSGSGILEIGRYIDFHTTDSIADFDARFDCSAAGTLNLVGAELLISGYRVYDAKNKPTSADVGLGNVQNWGATAAVNDASDTKYATAGAVKKAYDLAASKLAANENAVSASKLATARQINGTNFDGSGNITTANWGTARTLTIGGAAKSVNGAGNVAWSLDEIGAVSKGGDQLTGGLTFANADCELGWVFNTDYAKIGFKNDADSDTDSYMWFKTGDNGNEYFKWQSVSGANTTDWMSLKPTGLVVAAGVTAPTFTGALVGNAATATKLATARQINGTNFDGSGNITTANWGTARTLTIGDAAKSVNGAGNVSWSLAEIGAARSAGEVSSGEAENIDTATFVQWLKSIGAFNDRSWTVRCSWYYAGNRTITDTGCGNIHLAGCTIEVISANENAYTIRVITPTTTSYGGTTGAEFVYVNNGPDYAPGWRRIYTTSNKPTAEDVGLGNLANHGWNYSAVANTYAVRDGSGDLQARLLRSTYGDEPRITGAIAFRVNNSSDNYTRYCNSPSAVRVWLGAATASHTHTAAQGNADVIAGSWNAIGAMVFAQMYPADNLGAYAPGTRIPGSMLRPCSVDNDPDDMHSSSLPGTWQCQGYARGRLNNGEGDWTGHKTLWIRVA